MGCLKTPSCDLGRLPRSSSHGVFITHWMPCPTECGHQQSNVVLSINYKQIQIWHSHQANTFHDQQNSQRSTNNQQSQHRWINVVSHRSALVYASNLCHRKHLSLRQISQVRRNHKWCEIKAFADPIKKKSQVQTCRAQTPLESALLANHALQYLQQSCPQESLTLAW